MTRSQGISNTKVKQNNGNRNRTRPFLGTDFILLVQHTLIQHPDDQPYLPVHHTLLVLFFSSPEKHIQPVLALHLIPSQSPHLIIISNPGLR